MDYDDMARIRCALEDQMGEMPEDDFLRYQWELKDAQLDEINIMMHHYRDVN